MCPPSLLRQNKCQKRPNIVAKETYYMRTFESLPAYGKLSTLTGTTCAECLVYAYNYAYNTHTHTHTNTHIHTYIRIYIHIYIYKYIHTYV